MVVQSPENERDYIRVAIFVRVLHWLQNKLGISPDSRSSESECESLGKTKLELRWYMIAV